jgi:hypothetical protein
MMSEVQTLSPRSRAMLKLADKEADELGHRFVEPEHLLLVLMQTDGIPASTLMKLGADYERTREWVTNARMEKRNMVGSALQGASVRTRAVLKTAGEEAKSMSKDSIDPEHVLLGLLGEASTRENLQRVFNIDAENLRAEVYVALGLSAPARRYKSTSTSSHTASPISEPEPVKRNFFSNIPGVKEIPHPVDVDLGLERRIAPTGFSLKPVYIFLLLLLLIGFSFGFGRVIGMTASIGLGLLGLMFMAWYFGRRR